MPRTNAATRTILGFAALAAATLASSPLRAAPTKVRVISWNDLGMHCMDPGYQVFALLPPFNTFNTQVVADGKLVRGPGVITLTYESTPDPTGSINTTSAGKTDFWSHVPALFGVSLPVDTGLAGFAMPGTANTPKPVPFVAGMNWFHAEGIPITPYDDTGAKNPYPMLKTVARDPVTGAVLGSTVNVAPVSDEMDCARCHASGSSPFAMPETGWIFDGNVVNDWRLNILRLHDERNANDPLYASALAQKGYSAAGLLATVQTTGKAILCAACHASNALPGTGIAGISMLTSALHGLHADVIDSTGTTLDDVDEPRVVLHVPPGFGDALPARRDGQGDRRRRIADVSARLPRRHERSANPSAHAVAGRARTARMPHRHARRRTRAPSASQRLRRARQSARAGEQHVRDQRQRAAGQGSPLPLLRGPRRSAVLGVPRLAARDLSVDRDRTTTSRAIADAGPHRHDRRVQRVPRHDA
jgi:hypothetical protein